MVIGPGARKTVLVVDDDTWLRSLLAEMLAEDGYRVLEASTGLDVVRRVQSEHPDVLVLDVGLPWRSGLAILDALRAEEQTRRLPVVLISGNARLEQAARSGGAAAFRKPLDLEALLAHVARAAEAAA
jgi:CheY-like chemotaxis protein